MYAIIETGSKQYKVAVGDVLDVEQITNKKDVTFAHVLLIGDGDNISVGQPYVKGAKVGAEVVGAVRAKKVLSFKFRRRKSSRRLHGHRQDMTRIKITDITAG